MSDRAGDEAADRAKSRRRLLSLAEFVAVAGLLVAALTLYLNWSQRRSDAADKAATATAQRNERARLDLTATVENDGRRLALRDPNHDLQDVAIDFPGKSGIARQAPVGDPVIEAGPIADPILALTDGQTDTKEGRLPVLITVRYWDGDTARTVTGLYDVIWSTHGRLLRGRTLRLEGLRLKDRNGTPAKLDAAWAAKRG
ncbi:hypothetical protein [Sphingomonas sanguinis]|jgi:hypothetical protein|uniref:Uncharacterized protein n=1 Tax=Sphingomonas sanguinis TaxID=33051 RepID=A0A7Y7URE7_9SPHN|nr:hypothetical protein [Sphingomonas sanguinis]MBZ6381461.1 hypothetical protein [Sphingomonas sanguinis]NNG51102.1 hypothetical protein [Sphingomonas sanguinis]NNG52952.1 hypothetical protein [Sphingomonas sanguinis]NVP30763.1 hypothetical protein [Sphingomonas sanguinis]